MKKNKNPQSVLRFVVCQGFTKEVISDHPQITAANAARDDLRKAGTLASVRVANKSTRPDGTVDWAFI